jgi:hypothetical protein
MLEAASGILREVSKKYRRNLEASAAMVQLIFDANSIFFRRKDNNI